MCFMLFIISSLSEQATSPPNSNQPGSTEGKATTEIADNLDVLLQ